MLPHMVVPPPGPRSRALCDELARFESPGVSTMVTGDIPIVWERAKGSNVMDADGNVYVDLTGAFGVASLGHSDRRVTAALGRQARVLQHGLGDVHPHVGRVALARRLAELAPGRNNKVILCSTGAEAVEVAMKPLLCTPGGPGSWPFKGRSTARPMAPLPSRRESDFASLSQGKFSREWRGPRTPTATDVL